MSESNSVIKCLLTIFFDGDMPKAEAIVSPVNDDSNTTNPPCTPLSIHVVCEIYGKTWCEKEVKIEKFLSIN